MTYLWIWELIAMIAMEREEPGFGTGIYTISEAARILRVSSARVRGWCQGYVRYIRGEPRKMPPVLHRPVSEWSLLTFHDLVEMWFVKEFLVRRVRLPKIRAAVQHLSADWGTPYPLACNRLQTDGVDLLMHDAEGWRNVPDRQKLFDFVKEYIKDLEFDPVTCLANKWWPMGRQNPVVIDPRRSFGAPIIEESGTRTDVIYATFEAEQSVDAVATWYEIRVEAAHAAIEFEKQCRLAA